VKGGVELRAEVKKEWRGKNSERGQVRCGAWGREGESIDDVYKESAHVIFVPTPAGLFLPRGAAGLLQPRSLQ